ncbi:hypothetical protein BDF20DRAFT_836413 [Mycotypha africana]|uniref:uncharacterized protein n=1 Tax=Mycotypha africana TaxID=64632 RepID=UPI0022FFE7F4|nr:uncharacterized protein BDF20DRAFT_836413 [Mycotypha africana]KAI8977631.1 hypothetical protein BDF20DRAFT_836413 [Mycotypha africana]
MSSLTEVLAQLLDKRISFIRLLMSQGLWDRNDAENDMQAAIINLMKNENINLQQVQDLEESWQNFLNSSEANLFFTTNNAILLEGLAEMKYTSRVKRDFFATYK